jgi:hypothetical protein
MLRAIKNINEPSIYNINDAAATLIFAVAVDEEDVGEEELAQINVALKPFGARAEWTGNSDTDSSGNTTADAKVVVEFQ